MTAAHLNASLITIAVVGLFLGMRFVASPLVRVSAPPPVATVPASSTFEPQPQPESLIAVFIGHDPFRATRRPSNVVYDPIRLLPPATPPAPKPTLALVGIVWDNGSDPTALVEGFPGADGPRPVRQGETIAGLRVKAIKQDRVVISGLDTAWTLTVREPWR